MKAVLALTLALACSACTEDRGAAADPVAVERLLVRLETQRSGPVERLLPAKTEAKLNRADRLVAPIEKIGPEEINPRIAFAFLGR